MGLVSYTNLEDGNAAGANDINQRFGDVLAQVNGNLDSTNIRNGTLTRELFAQDAILAAWPVGSVHITVEDANPSSVLGGSWVKFGEGRTLMGVKADDTDFNVPEKTGGEKTVTLTTAQMPSHAHRRQNGGEFVGVNSASGGTQFGLPSGSYYNFRWGQTADTTFVGGGQAHNNLSPYITVYFWKRTA